MLAAVLSVLALSAVTVSAQGRPVRVDGVVQWIAGDKLMLILDGGQSIPVELRQVPQDQYLTLRQQDRITVWGTVRPDNRHVFATAITRFHDFQSP